MKRILQSCLAFSIMMTGMPLAPIIADVQNVMTEHERTETGRLKNYNIYLKGNHSAEMADIEGPLAVQGDSSLPSNLATFSYGAMFRESNNGVGDDIGDDQYNALVIGGRVNYEQTTDVLPNVSSQVRKGVTYGRVVTRDMNSIKSVFKHEVSDAQMYGVEANEIDTMFASFAAQQENIGGYLDTVIDSVEPYIPTNPSAPTKTLSEWYEGKEYQYPIFRSRINPKILVVNVIPDEFNTALIHSYGFDFDSIIMNDEIEQVIVTSFDRDSTGARIHAQNVVFRGNFLQNAHGTINVLDLAKNSENLAAKHVHKMTHYFPKAKQITNYFDHASYGSPLLAPKGLASDTLESGLLGIEAGALQFDHDYFANYATAGSNNGSASSGGGAALIGNVIAPSAVIVLASGSINGIVHATDLHQRFGAEIHNYISTWIFPDQPLSYSLRIHKVDYETEEALPNATFILKRYLETGVLYLKQNEQRSDWVEHKSDATVFITNEEGIIDINNLDLGTYYLEETSAPDGYQKLNNEIEVVVNENSSSNSLEITIPNFKDEIIKKGQLNIVKRDRETHDVLHDAEFVLYRETEFSGRAIRQYLTPFGTDSETSRWSSNILFAKRLKTNMDGEIHVENLDFMVDDADTALAFQYYLIETKAPLGYQNNIEPMPVSVHLENKIEYIDNTAVEPTIPILPNEPFASLYIEKVDGEDPSIKLADSHFNLSVSQEGSTQYLLYGINTPDGSYENVWGSVEPTQEAAPIVTDQTGDGYIKVFDVDEVGKLIESSMKLVSGVSHLRFGDYELKEVKAPNGYLMTDGSYPIHLEQEGLSEVKIKQRVTNLKKPTGGVTLHKTDDFDADHRNNLAGAQFVIYRVVHPAGEASYQEYLVNEESSIIHDFELNNHTILKQTWSRDAKNAYMIETNSDGYVHVNGFELGTYFMLETKAPEDHVQSDVPYPFMVQTKDAIVHVYAINQPYYTLKIVKEDAETSFPLEGAVFQLYALDKGNKVYRTTDHQLTTDANDIRTFWETNTEGNIIIDGIERGTYYLHEAKAPIGYEVLAEDRLLEITRSNVETTLDMVVENTKIPVKKGSLTINKTDETGKPLKGAVFAFFKDNDGQRLYRNLDGTWTNEEPFDSYTTDEDGAITLAELEDGIYYLEELEAPAGYEKIIEPIEIKLINQSMNDSHTMKVVNHLKAPLGAISLHKIDAETHVSLSDISFVFYQLIDKKPAYITNNPQSSWSFDKDQAKIFKTDREGMIEIGDLNYGDYYFQETETDALHVLDETPIPVTISKNSHEKAITVTNRQIAVPEILGSISLEKVDDKTGETLQGAAFILYKIEDGQNKYRTPDSWSTEETDAFRFISNAKGKITVDSLSLGDYFFKEVEAPDGYVLDETPYAVTLNKEGNGFVEVMMTNKKVEEPHYRGDVSLIKIASDTNNVLEGAGFVLFKVEDDTRYYRKQDTWTSNIESAERFTTQENGSLYVRDLDEGTYYFQEVVAPEGFMLDETPHEVTVNPLTLDIASTTVVNNPIFIEPERGSFTLTKRDADTDEHLSGAGFVLGKANEKLWYVDQETWTSDYESATVLWTNDEGILSVNDLELDFYTLEEVVAPVGYLLPTHLITFEVDTEINLELNAYNNKIAPEVRYGCLEIIKQDKETGFVLEGAEFILYNTELGYLVDQSSMTWSQNRDDATLLRSDIHGSIVITDLPMGTYQIIEVKAPVGYLINTYVIDVTIGEENDHPIVTIQNEKEKPTVPEEPEFPVEPGDPILPQTGMSPNYMYAIMGVLAVVAGVVIIIVKRKRD